MMMKRRNKNFERTHDRAGTTVERGGLSVRIEPLKGQKRGWCSWSVDRPTGSGKLFNVENGVEDSFPAATATAAEAIFGFVENDGSLYESRQRVTDLIYKHLKEGLISIFTPRQDLRELYGRKADRYFDPWLDFRRACERLADDDRCFVLVDETNDLHVATCPGRPGATVEDAAAYFQAPAAQYLKRCSQRPVKLTIFMLPNRNYSPHGYSLHGASFFWERGFYQAEATVAA
jgi:hypothetical protein